MTIIRAALTAALAPSVLAAPLAANAQPAGRVPRIGVLDDQLAADRSSRDAFCQGLRELGYLEGRNLAFARQYAAGNLDRLPELAAELVRLNLALIYGADTLSVRALKQATMTIPIVFAGLRDLVAEGLVISLARPGGNVTGISGITGDEMFWMKHECT